MTALARARFEIDELFVDRNRVFAGEIGCIGLAETPGAVAHRAAQGERRTTPDRFRARAVQHLWDDFDTGRQVISADDL